MDDDNLFSYVGSKEEEMDAEGADVDADNRLCLQCEERPKIKAGALCAECRENIPF